MKTFKLELYIKYFNEATQADPLNSRPIHQYYKEILEDEYYEMLGVLPPERQVTNAFLVGEPFDHTTEGPRYACYAKFGEGYAYFGYMTTKLFDSLCE